MKKLKNSVIFLALLFSAVFLASCKQPENKPVEISFNQTNIVLQLGEEKALSEFFVIKNARFNDSRFASSNTKVAIVTPDKKVKAVGEGVTSITATVGDKVAHMSVSVSVPLQKFDAIKEISFNPTTNTLSWLPAYVIKNDQVIGASLYTIYLTKDNQTEVKTTTNTYLQITEAGQYSVVVRASATGYDLSEQSEKVEFTLLPQVQGFAYNKQTKVLSWNSQASALKYIVDINGEKIEITGTSYNLSNHLATAGTYNVFVKAENNGSLSLPTQTIKVVKLNTPTVTITGGEVKVSLEQASLIEKFVLTAKNAQNASINYTFESTTGVFTLPDVAEGNYNITIATKAVAQGYVYDAELASPGQTIKKLQASYLTFNKNTKQIGVNFAKNILFFENIDTGVVEQVNLNNSLTYTFNKQFGTYKVYSQTQASNNNEIKSDFSNSVEIKILGAIENVGHYEQNGFSYISFPKVQGIDLAEAGMGYTLELQNYNDNLDKVYSHEDANLIVYKLTTATNTLFANAGEYTVSVFSFDNSYEDPSQGKYLISAETRNKNFVKITRLGVPSDFAYVNENDKVSWQRESSLVRGYNYILLKQGVVVAESSVVNSELSTQNLSFGNYVIRVYQKGDGYNVLNALVYAEHPFKVKAKLASPVVTFDVNTNKLTISPVDNAEHYQVFHNETLINKPLEEDLTLDISEFITTAGTHNFDIIALSLTNSAEEEGNGNLYNSDPFNVRVVKLESIDSIIFNEDGSLTIDGFNTYVQKPNVISLYNYEILLNDNPVTLNGIDLSLSPINVLKIKKLPNLVLFPIYYPKDIVYPEIKNILEKVYITNIYKDPVYYVASDQTTFTLSRIETPTELKFENMILSWKENENTSDYLITLSSGSLSYSFNTTYNNVNLSGYLNDIDPAIVENGFSFNVKYNVKNREILSGTTGFISSLVSDSVAVGKLEKTTITNVEEIAGQISITWNQIENAEEYEVIFNSTSTRVEENSFEFTPSLEVSTYNFSVKAINKSYLAAQQTTLRFERLQPIRNVEISKNERLTLGYVTSNAVKVLINGEEYENFVDLTQVEVSEEYQIQLIGKKNIEGTYYLDSIVNVFRLERLGVVEDLLVQNEVASWKYVYDADLYEIKITRPDEEVLTLEIPALNASNQPNTSILLTRSEIALFATISGRYKIEVRAVVNGYTLQADTQGFLSGKFEQEANFDKLEKITNLAFTASADILQAEVTLTWDENQAATSYEVYVNGNRIDEVFTNSYTTNYFTYQNSVQGRFIVKVIAKSSQAISSEFSDDLVFNRLPNVNQQSLVVSETAEFSWGVVKNSQGYSVYYQKQNQEASEPIITNEIRQNFQTQIYEDAFFGNIDFYVLAIGDGVATLSSAYAKISKVKLDVPHITITGESVTSSQSVIYPNASYMLKVYFVNALLEEREVFSVRAGANQTVTLPDVWTINGQEIVEEGMFRFETYFVADGYINSSKENQTIEKLKNLNIQGFVKTDLEKHATVFKVDASALQEISSIEFVLIVESAWTQTYTDNTAVPNSEGILIYELDGTEFGLALNGSFEIKLQAKAVGYLNSKTEILNGIRLEQVATLGSKNGVLGWSYSSAVGASGYLLKAHIASGEEDIGKTTYIQKDLTSLTDQLTGESGKITANVKVLGNVGDTLVKNNVVLDSLYKSEVTYVADQARFVSDEQPFIATKLKAPANTSIEQGLFKFEKVEDANGYTIVDAINNREYTIDDIAGFDQTIIKGTSEQLYQGTSRLLTGVTYTLSIKATSTAANVLNSDAEGDFKVQVLANPNQSVSDIDYNWTMDAKSIVKFTWNASLIKNEYILDIYGLDRTDNSTFKNTPSVTSTTYNLNTEYFDKPGEYYLRVRVAGSSALENTNFYYLASAYSPKSTFKKLAAPELRIEDGVLRWKQVAGANAYVVYYRAKNSPDDITYQEFINTYNEYSTLQYNLYWNLPDSFGSATQSKEYFIGVKAINTSVSEKMAPSHLSVLYKLDGSSSELETDYVRPITVLKSPNNVEVYNGSIMWKNVGYKAMGIIDTGYNISVNLQTGSASLQAGDKPFVYTDNLNKLADLRVTMKIVNKEGTTNGYTSTAIFKATEMYYANLFNLEQFKAYASEFGLNANFEFGWPTLNKFVSELGVNVFPGVNRIHMNQIGNDTDWLTSMYNDGFEVYIPHKVIPSINNHIISWNDVQITSPKPYNAEYKYFLIVENSSGQRKIIYKTNSTSIDLQPLIDQEILTPGYQKLYVMIAGDSGYYTNGIPSNAIEVYVLSGVEARLEKGILKWDSITGVTNFFIKADPSNPAYYFEQSIQQQVWEFGELAPRDASNAVLRYQISIRAIGNGITILSGKESKFGTISKLDTPNPQINRGRFEWTNVENNFGYNVNVKKEVGEENVEISKDTIYYESTISGFNKYNFRSLGSTSGSLNESAENFAISNYMVTPINAALLPSIQSFNVVGGQLVWNSIKNYDGNPVGEYKITFDSINYFAENFITDFKTDASTGVDNVIYDFPEMYVAGSYKIYVQAYSNDTYMRQGVAYRYLLGKILDPESSLEFIKLRSIYDIKTQDGVISWSSDNAQEHRNRIVFTRGAQTVSFITETTHFNPLELNEVDYARYTTLIPGQNYDIKVQALGDDEILVSSNYVEAINFKKLSTIADVVYTMTEEATSGFMIRWYVDSVESSLASSFEFVIKFSPYGEDGEFFIWSTKGNSKFRKGYSAERQAFYAEIDATELLGQDATKLAYYISIIPVSINNYLISDYSELRTVAPPKSLSEDFGYMSNERKITWEYEGTGTDVTFRIVDELIQILENGTLVVVKTNIYTTQMKEFFPQETGFHRISIAVVLEGKEVSSPYTYFKHTLNTVGLINREDFVVENGVDLSEFTLLNMNLFASGEGTSANPYIIQTESEFKNINYRLTKPEYLLGELMFYFKQDVDLTMTLTSSMGEFGGVYDGNGKQLKYTLTNNQNIGTVQGTLFSVIKAQAKIANLTIDATIRMLEKPNVNQIELSALAGTNNGRIENVTIKAFVYNSEVSRGITYFIGGVAINNNGQIVTVVNNSNIMLEGGVGQPGINQSSIYVGGIVYTNSGTLSQVGNKGNIYVNARTIRIGGIAAQNQVGGVIEFAYYKGSIKVKFMNDSAVGLTSDMGGLVGINYSIIRSSYATSASFSIDADSKNQTVNAGGIAGSLRGENGANISNSYTTTTNISIINVSNTNYRIGLFAGVIQASDLLTKVTSYYMASTGKVATEGSANNLELLAISTSQSLLANLNSVQAVFKAGASYPLLIWEN